MKDTSQYEQTKILMTLFNGEEEVKQHPQFALEIGAFDGVTNSNVKPFFDLGWSGICIEPDPISFKKVFKLHSQNPSVQVYNICISDTKPDIVDFYGVSEKLQYSDRQLSSLSKKFSDDINNERNVKANVTKKLALNLNDFNNAFTSEYNISYLSLDCECYDELIILSTKFDTFRPKVIQAEFQYDDKIVDSGVFKSACQYLSHNWRYDVYKFKKGSDILAIDSTKIGSLNISVLNEMISIDW